VKALFMDGQIRSIAAVIVENVLASADKTQKKAEKKEIKTIGFLIELPVWRRFTLINLPLKGWV